MRQYLDAKQQHRDAILFFRMGDFYEMFYEDALVAARALELTLTSRSKDANGGGIPMCGVPFHAVDGYIARLVKKGFRVAICDQVEDPRKAKGLVKREVVRVVSPGTLTDASYLDAREPAFLMAIAPAGPNGIPGRDRGRAARPFHRRVHRRGVSRAGRPRGARRRDRAAPAARDDRPRPTSTSRPACRWWPRRPSPVTPVDAWTFDGESARRALLDQLQTRRPRGLRPGDAWRGRGGRRRARAAPPGHPEARPGACPRHPATASAATRCSIDPTTLRHLEIRRGIRGRARRVRCSKSSIAPSRRSAAGSLRAWLLAAAGRPRADSRSAGRGRGARVSHHRSRQVPRDIEEHPGPRAPGRAGRARHRRPARLSWA